MEQTAQKGLVRGVRRWDLVAFIINALVGAGIFGLPSRIYGLTGSWSVLAYLTCAILTASIILCFAEVASRFAETGGPYLYARVAFGPAVGFQVGWLLWLARLTAFAALCNLLLGYLSYFWPSASSGLTRGLVIAAVVIALSTVNLVGVRQATLVNNFLTVGKLTPLLVFVAAGLFFVSPQSFAAPAEQTFSDFSRAVLLLVFAFSGFEATVIPAGEMRDPQRHVAFALLIATVVVALLYLLIQVVCIGTLPGLENSERPLVDASSLFLGSSGASLLSAGALISVSGTLNANVLAAPRILFAMAEQGQLPSGLAATHRRFRTPHVAILISSATMLVITLQGTFMSALTISTVIRLLSYIATCVALPVMRLRDKAPIARFNAPGGVAVAVVATILSVWLLAHTPLNEALAAGFAAALGLPIFFLWGRARREA